MQDSQMRTGYGQQKPTLNMDSATRWGAVRAPQGRALHGRSGGAQGRGLKKLDLRVLKVPFYTTLGSQIHIAYVQQKPIYNPYSTSRSTRNETKIFF